MGKKPPPTKLAPPGTEGLQKRPQRRKPGPKPTGVGRFLVMLDPLDVAKAQNLAESQGIPWSKWLRRVIRAELARI